MDRYSLGSENDQRLAKRDFRVGILTLLSRHRIEMNINELELPGVDCITD